MKLTIIGSTGFVGSELVKEALKNFNQIDEICCFYHSNKGKNKLIGMLNDLLLSNINNKIKITNNYLDTANSDICVICAGKAVSPNIKKISEGNVKIKDNRDLLYEKNKDIVMKCIDNVYKFSKNSLIILVTNPVSRLLKDIYTKYPKIKAVGCGVINDTFRVRNEYSKVYDDKCENLFVIGEHNLLRQTVALEFFNTKRKQKLERKIFEVMISREKKEEFIKKLKKQQNELILRNDINTLLEWNIDFPLLYRSYFIHRMSNFLYRTHISTTVAIEEIIRAYLSEKEIVSVEIKYHFLGEEFIVGLPIKFENKNIQIVKIPMNKEEIDILNDCKKKFKIEGVI